jgi:hypothetical protein
MLELVNAEVGARKFGLLKNGDVVTYGEVYLQPAKKLFLDGGGDSYLAEGAANTVQLYLGGSKYNEWGTSRYHMGASGLAYAARIYGTNPNAGDWSGGYGGTGLDISGATTADGTNTLKNSPLLYLEAPYYGGGSAKAYGLGMFAQALNTSGSGVRLRFAFNSNDQAITYLGSIGTDGWILNRQGKIEYAGADSLLKLQNINSGGLTLYVHAGETARYASKWKISDNPDVTLGNVYLEGDTSGNIAIRSGGKLFLDGSVSGDTYLIESSANVIDVYAAGVQVATFQSNQFKHVITALSADPTTGNLPSGFGAWFKNTTANEIRFWYNDGGTMKKSAALT